MPKITIEKSDLEGLKNPPAGIYDFKLDGFKPKAARAQVGKEASVNLRPTLTIINHPTMNDKPIMANGNTAFAPFLFDMCHALGVPYEGEDTDNPSMPGEFVGPDDDPTKWDYQGPLAGQVGKIEIGDTTYKGTAKTDVKKFFCRVPGCQARHRDSLMGNAS